MDNTEKLEQFVDEAGYFITDNLLGAVRKAYSLGKEESQEEVAQLKRDITFLSNMYADYVKQSNEFSMDMTNRLVAEILR